MPQRIPSTSQKSRRYLCQIYNKSGNVQNRLIKLGRGFILAYSYTDLDICLCPRVEKHTHQEPSSSSSRNTNQFPA